MYDFVFDVDMEDGKPPLKLPYNVSQGPYEAATKFIQDNEAPVGYLEQVANFIITNTQGHTIGQAAPAQGAPDPWGSDNRYRPDDATPARPSPPPVKSLPHKEYIPISLDPAALPKIQKKLIELNKNLVANGHKDKSMNPQELRILADLCSHLGSKDTKVRSESVEGGLQLAVKLATEWPYKDRLPGLDLLRSLALSPETATYSASGGDIIDIFEGGAMKEDPSGDNHIMMALRGFANLFASPEGRALALREFEKIQGITVKASSSPSRNVLIAVTTIYVNYAVLFNAGKDAAPFDYALAVVEVLGKILEKQKDSEVLFRALMALGTVVCVDDEVKSAAGGVYEVGKAVDAAVKKAPEPRIKNAAREVGDLLK